MLQGVARVCLRPRAGLLARGAPQQRGIPVCNTHRAGAAKPTLGGAIEAFEFVKTTAPLVGTLVGPLGPGESPFLRTCSPSGWRFGQFVEPPGRQAQGRVPVQVDAEGPAELPRFRIACQNFGCRDGPSCQT
jgi:hypothetical protein